MSVRSLLVSFFIAYLLIGVAPAHAVKTWYYDGPSENYKVTGTVTPNSVTDWKICTPMTFEMLPVDLDRWEEPDGCEIATQDVINVGPFVYFWPENSAYYEALNWLGFGGGSSQEYRALQCTNNTIVNVMPFDSGSVPFPDAGTRRDVGIFGPFNFATTPAQAKIVRDDPKLLQPYATWPGPIITASVMGGQEWANMNDCSGNRCGIYSHKATDVDITAKQDDSCLWRIDELTVYAITGHKSFNKQPSSCPARSTVEMNAAPCHEDPDFPQGGSLCNLRNVQPSPSGQDSFYCIPNAADLHEDHHELMHKEAMTHLAVTDIGPYTPHLEHQYKNWKNEFKTIGVAVVCNSLGTTDGVETPEKAAAAMKFAAMVKAKDMSVDAYWAQNSALLCMTFGFGHAVASSKAIDMYRGAGIVLWNAKCGGEPVCPVSPVADPCATL